jgi:hypothetical protein
MAISDLPSLTGTMLAIIGTVLVVVQLFEARGTG